MNSRKRKLDDDQGSAFSKSRRFSSDSQLSKPSTSAYSTPSYNGNNNLKRYSAQGRLELYRKTLEETNHPVKVHAVLQAKSTKQPEAISSRSGNSRDQPFLTAKPASLDERLNRVRNFGRHNYPRNNYNYKIEKNVALTYTQPSWDDTGNECLSASRNTYRQNNSEISAISYTRQGQMDPKAIFTNTVNSFPIGNGVQNLKESSNFSSRQSDSSSASLRYSYESDENDTENSVGNGSTNNSNVQEIDESMDWNDIEEEILHNLQELRQTTILSDKPKTQFQEIISQNLKNIPANKKLLKDIYVVVDTNIFISHLNVIKDVLNLKINGNESGVLQPIIIIPWMVIQELDYIKEDRSKTRLNEKAQLAIRFINDQLTNQNPYITGQSIHDASEQDFSSKNADDSVLHCCLQIFKKGNQSILLSNDINLRNKAIIQGIRAFGHNTILEELDVYNKVKKEDTESEKSQNNKHVEIENSVLKTISLHLSHTFSLILLSELKDAYGIAWNNMNPLKRKPPWSLEDCLFLFKKYWQAVFSIRLQKQFTKTTDDFSKCVQDLNRKKPINIKHFTDVAFAMCLYLQNGYPVFNNTIKECVANIKNLI